MIEIYFDGACVPFNPGGHGGAGYMILNGSETYRGSVYLGQGPWMSSNYAEYAALFLALKEALELGLQKEHIDVYGDSTIVIGGSKNRKLSKGLCGPMSLECLGMIKNFKDISFEWIPREENYMADDLSKKGADSQCADSVLPRVKYDFSPV